jgi:predicted alpha/beta-fold hydrolase
MPNLDTPDYQPNFLNRLTHFNTICTAMFRKAATIPTTRHRLELKDGDFMDLDLSLQGRERLVILIHGLEGAADRPYMVGMAAAFHKIGFDSLLVNLRGCSGEVNRLVKTYHSGATGDLQYVLDYVFQEHLAYQEIVILGFSLGGNIVLKYTGDAADQIDPRIKAAVGVSVPCDLTSCAVAIKEQKNFIYNRRFLSNLRAKVKAKKDILPLDMDYEQLLSAKNFHEFDHWFTAKVNGFKSAAHYWESCSSKPVLSQVAIPTLLLTAQDDSFLGEECYPYEIAEHHPLFYFIAPKYGGHVGFSGDNRDGMLWSEYTVTQFVLKKLADLS